MDKLDDKSRAEIVFVGSTLGPLFLHDPEHDAQVVATGLEALASLDVEAAAKDWPFVSAEDAERALALMHEGLAEGTKSDALVWEYRRLFVGPLAKPAPPWGSVYTDKDMVVFGASTMQQRDWIRRNRGGLSALLSLRRPHTVCAPTCSECKKPTRLPRRLFFLRDVGIALE